MWLCSRFEIWCEPHCEPTCQTRTKEAPKRADATISADAASRVASELDASPSPRRKHRRTVPAVSNVDSSGTPEPMLTLSHGDRVAIELTSLINKGELDALRRLLAERPGPASARMIGRKGLEGDWRTPCTPPPIGQATSRRLRLR
jgi:hypothetical protein